MKFWTKYLFLAFLGFSSNHLEGKTWRAPKDRYSLSDWEKFRDMGSFYPYLCELSYRTLADHVIDPNNRDFDPEKVREGDIIYLAVWYLDWFVEQIHDKIPNPYILVTCDVGAWIPSPNHIRLAYDPKVAYWFAKNMLFTHHSKLFQLPMGQFYFLWAHGVLPSLQTFNALVSSPPKKDILLYLNHTERDHGRRILVAEKFYNQPYCFSRNKPRQAVGFEQYWEELARSQFILSPLGLEVDCTRTWECFSLGTIPIVEHSYLDPLYDELPILLIHNWDEINEEFLHRKYSEIREKPSNPEKAYLDYWAKVLHEKKQQIRQGNLCDSTLEANNFTDNDLIEIQSLLSQHNKSKCPLLYRGNFTSLRAFQLASKIPSLKEIYLCDIWLEMKYLQKYSNNTSLLKTNKIKICNPKDLQPYFKNKLTYFLDLIHFRHALLSSLDELRDFEHSLEKDIRNIYDNLERGSLLIGNEANDNYVMEVLNRLKQKSGLKICIKKNFWYCTKN